ncbi:MAG: hypothetical protein ACK5YA_00485, partial [bacterium]
MLREDSFEISVSSVLQKSSLFRSSFQNQILLKNINNSQSTSDLNPVSSNHESANLFNVNSNYNTGSLPLGGFYKESSKANVIYHIPDKNYFSFRNSQFASNQHVSFSLPYLDTITINKQEAFEIYPKYYIPREKSNNSLSEKTLLLLRQEVSS